MAEKNASDQTPLRLALGTAQLGMDYGVANRRGKPGMDVAVEIVRTAWGKGIRFFDTAQAYGDSEMVLGRCFRELGRLVREDRPMVISKIDPSISITQVDRITAKVEESLDRMGLEELWGLMLHREAFLEAGVGALRDLSRKLKQEKRIRYFGISVYSPEKALEALNRDEIDLVQVPFNVFDQRAMEQGVFSLGMEKNKRVFVRSVYLQGLLLLAPEELPEGLSFARDVLGGYHELCMRTGVSAAQFALSYVAQKALDSILVIGAEAPSQVGENVAFFRACRMLTIPDVSFLSSRDLRLINPSHWER